MNTSFLRLVLLAFLLVFPTYSFAQSGGNGNNGYQGPRQLTSGQANAVGGCNCGSTVSGAAGSSGILIAAALGLYVASVITDENGDVVEVIYEDVVAVAEIERIGNDLYISVTEVRAADVPDFIASQNQPDNIFQVITAEDYAGGDINVPGHNVSTLQVIELPPEDTYEYVYYVEPGGGISDWTGITGAIAQNEIAPNDQFSNWTDGYGGTAVGAPTDGSGSSGGYGTPPGPGSAFAGNSGGNNSSGFSGSSGGGSGSSSGIYGYSYAFRVTMRNGDPVGFGVATSGVRDTESQSRAMCDRYRNDGEEVLCFNDKNRLYGSSSIAGDFADRVISSLATTARESNVAGRGLPCNAYNSLFSLGNKTFTPFEVLQSYSPSDASRIQSAGERCKEREGKTIECSVPPGRRDAECRVVD